VPINRSSTFYTRATQRPKTDAAVVNKPPPPPRAGSQPLLPSTPTTTTADFESPKVSVPRPSRWDPAPEDTPTPPPHSAPSFQQPTRSPLEDPAPSSLAQSWSQPRHSPSYPSSVGRSSPGSTPTNPLPYRRPDQSFPISPPRRPSRFGPPANTGIPHGSRRGMVMPLPSLLSKP
jgi:hypothetical protein